MSKTGLLAFAAENEEIYEIEEIKETKETKIGLRDNKPIVPVSIPGGISYIESENVRIDYSFANEAYFTARNIGADEDVLIIVEGPEDSEDTYLLNNGKEWQSFSLQKKGEYTVKIGRKSNDGIYYVVMSHSFVAEFKDSLLPYLRPDIDCMYDSSSAVIKITERILNEGKVDNDKEAIDAVINWLSDSGFEYDFEGREEGYNGNYTYLNPDETFSGRKGVCKDFAVLTCAMFRSQGIPTKIVVEKSDEKYHAWIKVYNEGVWLDYDPTEVVIYGSEYFSPDKDLIRQFK